MTKRKAPFDLEREAIDRDEIVNNDEQKLETGRISTEAEIKNRKILKVKDKLQPETGNFKFEFAKLPVGEQQNKTAECSFVNIQQSSTTETKNTEGGGFNITEVKLNTGATSGLFNNNKKIEEAKPLFNNLFNNNNKEQEKTSLFANNNKNEQDKSKAEEQPKQGLFSGLFGNNKNSEQQKEGENNKNSDNKKDENKPQGLFANLNSGGLFATAGTQQSSIFNKPQDNNLFTKNLQSGPPTTGGLFSNIGSLGSSNNQGLNFNQPTTNFFLAPKQDANNEDDDGNESDGNVSNQSAEIDPTKSSGNYSYENALSKLIEKNITKFRRNNNDILEKGSITVEKKKEGDMVLVIYRNQIKQILYQGVIIKKASSLRKICDKDENLSLTLYSENKDKKKEEDLPYLKDICKIQFLNKENGVEFQEIFNKQL